MEKNHLSRVLVLLITLAALAAAAGACGKKAAPAPTGAVALKFQKAA